MPAHIVGQVDLVALAMVMMVWIAVARAIWGVRELHCAKKPKGSIGSRGSHPDSRGYHFERGEIEKMSVVVCLRTQEK
jgi:hypothetical protein